MSLRHCLLTASVLAALVVPAVATPGAGGAVPVDQILVGLMNRLMSVQKMAVDLDATFRSAQAEAAAVKGAYGRAQVDPRRVATLRVELERMSAQARATRTDIRGKTAKLARYRGKLLKAHPTRRAELERYFGELIAVRNATEELCRNVERQAPRSARDLARLMRQGFGSYMAAPGTSAVRSSEPVVETPRAPRSAAAAAAAPTAAASGDAELDAFFGGATSPTATSPASSSSSDIPPLMVDPADLSPEERAALEGGAAEPPVSDDEIDVSMGDIPDEPVPTPPAPPATKPAPAPTKPAPAPTKPTVAPTKPAPAPTKPTAAPTKPAGEEDFEGFMDFGDDARLPSEDEPAGPTVAMVTKGEGFRTFADRMADEFRRSGVVDRVGAPPRGPQEAAPAQAKATFAERITQEIRGGAIPDARDLFPGEAEQVPAPSAATKAPTSRAGEGRIQKLMRELGRL